MRVIMKKWGDSVSTGILPAAHLAGRDSIVGCVTDALYRQPTPDVRERRCHRQASKIALDLINPDRPPFHNVQRSITQ